MPTVTGVRAGSEDAEPQFPQELSDADLVDFYRNALDDAESEESSHVLEDDRYWKLYAGISTSDEDQRFLAENPEVVATDVAIFQAIMHTFLGSEMAQKVEPTFGGQDLSRYDQQLAEWMTTVVRKLWVDCGAEEHVWDAVQDCGVTGRGYCLGYIATNQRPVRPVIKARQTWRVKPDPDATEMNYADAEYFVIREPAMLLDDAVAMWPAFEADLRARATNSSALMDSAPTAPKTSVKTTNPGRRRHRKTVDVDTLLWRSSHRRVQFVDPKTGEYRNEPAEEYEALREQYNLEYEEELEAYSQAAAQAAQMGMPYEVPPPGPVAWDEESVDPYVGHCYYIATLVASAAGRSGEGALLLDRKRIGINEFTLKAITGLVWKKPSQDRIKFFGLGRVCFDIIAYMNKAMRSWVDIVGRASKLGGFLPEGLGTERIEEFRRNNAVPNYWHAIPEQFMPGQQAGIQERHAPQIPSDFKEIFMFCLDLLGRVTGVNEWLQGTGTGDRSNAFVSNLQEQGAARLLPLRKPRIKFVTELGRMLAAFVIRHMPAGEIDRILGELPPALGVTHEEGEQGPTPKMMRDPKTGEQVEATPGRILKTMDLLAYDINADVGATTPNQRFSIANFFTQHGMAQALINDMGVDRKVVARRVIKYSLLPEGEAAKMLEEAESAWEQEEKMQTEQGAIEHFQGLPPEAQVEFMQQLQQMMLGPGASALAPETEGQVPS